jgi:CRISPR system Cascade subunit CasA
MAHDILNDPLIEVTLDGELRLVTMPDLFAAWGSRQDIALAGVRHYQRPAVHMFFCQLGAVALERSDDEPSIGADADAWRKRLLRLAPAEAWHLIADDAKDPALLQPPTDPDDVRDFTAVSSPDDLTILVASKNHASKQSRISGASPWTWICALVEFQTMSGYAGAKNYGVMRMNGGNGSRPLVSIYPGMSDGARWRRDVEVIVASSDKIRGSARFFAPPGKGSVAMWTVPWDGRSQLDLGDLDPLCVEVARPLRLQIAGGVISARVGNSEVARVAGTKELKGRLGDPWGPLDDKGGKLLTVSGDGWSLRRLRNLIVPDGESPYMRSLLQIPTPSERGDMVFHACVTAGGQGKTDGFHEATVPIPGSKVVSLFETDDGATRIGQLATQMIADADTAKSALKTGLFCFAQGGVRADAIFWDKRETSGAASHWLHAFQRAVEHEFFDRLWEADDADGDRLNWRLRLRQLATDLYAEATEAIPVHSEVFWRAETRGRGLLLGKLNREFPETKRGVAAEEAA